MRIRKPYPVAAAEARMTVHTQAEVARQQLGADNIADRLILDFHCLVFGTPVPGQPRAKALTADQKGHALLRIDWRVAHQVHPIGIGSRAHGHATRVDDGHEHQAHRFKLAVQRAVPLQAHHQTLQIGNHHTRADPLQTMDSTKIADRRHLWRRVAQGNHIDRIAAAIRHAHLANKARLNPAGTQLDDALQGDQFRQLLWGHSQLRRASARWGAWARSIQAPLRLVQELKMATW